MRKPTLRTVSLLVIACACQLTSKADDNWPQFRGRHAIGIADQHTLPTQWNIKTGQAVQWKTPIPGLAHSCPIVWEDRIFLTTAISENAEPKLKVGLYGDIGSVKDEPAHRWEVLCIQKQTGKILWSRTAHIGIPKIKRHPKATHANSTPATDGKHVVAMFGSEGLYCYSVDGDLLWKKDLGVLDSGFYIAPGAQWGFASSPILWNESVIVQCDVQAGSFIAAFDLKDGRQIWRTPRNEIPTWSTPTLLDLQDKSLVIVNGYKNIAAYDAKTGELVWHMRGGGDIPVPTPIFDDQFIYVTNAHGRMAPIYAIRKTATGDISLKDKDRVNPHVAWSYRRAGGYMQTPIRYGDNLYVCRDNGVLSAYRAADGEMLYQERLGKGRTGFTASPVAGDGKLYFTSEQGQVHVVKPGPNFKVLHVNELNDICMATPAISAGTILFRTRSHLIAVAQPGKPTG